MNLHQKFQSLTRRRRSRNIKNYQEPEADLWSDSHQYYDGHNTSSDPWNNAVDNWNKSMASQKMVQSKDCGNYVDYDNLRKKPDQNIKIVINNFILDIHITTK